MTRYILVSLRSYRNRRPIHYDRSAGSEICQQFDAAEKLGYANWMVIEPPRFVIQEMSKITLL